MRFAWGLVLVVVACGGAAPAPPPPPPPSNVAPAGVDVDPVDCDDVGPQVAPADVEAFFECVLRRFDAFRDQGCRCSTAACLEDLKVAMHGWEQRLRRRVRPGKPTKAQAERLDEIDDALEACHDRVVPRRP